MNSFKFKYLKNNEKNVEIKEENINNEKNVEIKEENINNECAICLQNIENEYKLDCNHIFCYKCIEKVIEKFQIKCPLCRNITYLKIENNFIYIDKSEIKTDVSDLIEFIKTMFKLYNIQYFDYQFYIKISERMDRRWYGIIIKINKSLVYEPIVVRDFRIYFENNKRNNLFEYQNFDNKIWFKERNDWDDLFGEYKKIFKKFSDEMYELMKNMKLI